MKTIGIYHKNCTDGTTAAAVLLLRHPDCKLYSFDHNYKDEDINNLLQDVGKDTVIYILDFALREDDIQKVLKQAKEVINIDHHISVRQMLEDLSKRFSKFKFVFDNNACGASLTYKYLFGENIPKILKYVEDKDIWKWEFGEETKHVNNYLFLYTNQPEKMKEILTNEDLKVIIEKGKTISEYTSYLINSFVDKSKDLFIKIGDYKVRAYNTGLFQSEIGNILSTKFEQSVCLFSINGDYAKLSFRSLDNHTPSALDLARLLGGGGHRNAAGASVSLTEFCNMLLI